MERALLQNSCNKCNKKQQSVLVVNCFKGYSRSASIIIAFLMKKKCYNFCQALQLIQSKIPQINPNYGFIKQLIEYEKLCKM